MTLGLPRPNNTGMYVHVFWLWLLSQALPRTTKGDKNDIYSFFGDEGGLFAAKTHLNMGKRWAKIFFLARGFSLGC